ncbi:MAG TPA: hypothetical protein VLT87_06545 [Thermoanaerobaculia bacterium]|nr:hypothetical protein [Thermoanaerobaculia bacterium]
MAKPATLDPTVAFLYAHGITVAPEALDELVKEAVSRLQKTLYRPDPRADLPAPEAEILRKGGFVLEPANLGTEDPLARTVAEYAALLKSSLSTTDAARRLGVDPSRIRQRLTSSPPTLYGIRAVSGWVLPEFQFDGNELVSSIGEVVARLDPELHPVSVFRWFTTPNPDLVAENLGGRTLSPREWLRSGLPVQAVVDLAANL